MSSSVTEKICYDLTRPFQGADFPGVKMRQAMVSALKVLNYKVTTGNLTVYKIFVNVIQICFLYKKTIIEF